MGTSVHARNASKFPMTSKMHIAQFAIVTPLLSAALFISARPYQAETAISSPPKHSTAIPREATGIPNFAEVSPQLYRGAQPDRKGIGTLKKLGVDIVVDMRGGRNKAEKTEVNEAGMQFVSIPWHCPRPKDKPFARFLKLIEENPKKKFFVHCRLGDDRTGMAVAAYRMAEQGWSADEALKEMQTFGFDSLHHRICPGLRHYEMSFPKRLERSSAFKDLRRNTHQESD
jgi:tyrosine-protein phosphatase SIW14